jgi:hypothetical protein
VQLQPAPENECLALRCHRASQAHGVLPSAAAQALLAPVSHQHRWRAGAWVRVLEGRPSAILAPVLALVDTNMGMRLRGCANTPSGKFFLLIVLARHYNLLLNKPRFARSFARK